MKFNFNALFFKQVLLGTLIAASALHSYAQPDLSEYRQQIEAWHQNRIDALKKPNGWLNLEGLFWLHTGINKLGTAPESDCRYINPNPAAQNFPAYLGDFKYEGDSVVWQTNKGYQITVNNLDIASGKQITVFSREQDRVTMGWADYTWTIIKREDKVGVRFRNLKAIQVSAFKGIDRFKVDTKWRIKAKLNAPIQSQLMIMNVLGQNTATKNAGKLFFNYEGKEYTLDVIDEGGPLYFITFADETSDKTTYGAGRFIEIPKPDANGNTEIDFNKAYNPPCAFTAFATCPLPPPQNRLPIAITAGEKKYGHH